MQALRLFQDAKDASAWLLQGEVTPVLCAEVRKALDELVLHCQETAERVLQLELYRTVC
jgi:hypothetical protein